MAAWYAASASTGCPVARNKTPRLLWAFAWFGIDCDRTPGQVDCEIQLVARLQDDAEVAMPVGLIWHVGRTPRDEREGFVVPTLLMRQHTGVVQRTGMIGRSHEYPPVQLVSLGELLVFLSRRIANETASSSVNSPRRRY